MRKRLLVNLVLSTLVAACGGGGGGNVASSGTSSSGTVGSTGSSGTTGTTGTTGGGLPTAQAMQAQGVFQGSVSGPGGLQNAPATILITPHNEVVTVFHHDDPLAPVMGLITGTGSVVSSSPDAVTLNLPAVELVGNATCTGSVSVNVTRDPSTGGVSVSSSSSAAGSSSASSDSSSTSSGSCSFSTSVSASTPPADSTFSFSTPASVSAVAGTWVGEATGQSKTTVTIASDGAVTGSAGSCTFTGQLTPNAQYNYFTVRLSFGSGCNQLAGVTAEGFVVTPTASTLLAALTDTSASHAAVFMGTRSTVS